MKAEVCKKLELNCDNDPYNEKVGGLITTYCCEKGFHKALEQFTKSVK